MGEVRAKITIHNYSDVLLIKKGHLNKEAVRYIELDSLADSGSVETLIPEDASTVLGLETFETVIVTLANDEKIELPIAGPVLITVCNRRWIGNCLIGPPGCEPLFGQIIMESLDLVINPRAKTITVNPASPFLPTLKLK